MKKQLLVLLLILLIPFVVNAETCDTNKISISSITIKEKNGEVEELESATANGKNINLNLSMLNVGDNIEYKVVIKNESNEDYKLDINDFNISSDFINYSISSDDNSNIVKANSSETIYLKVEYKNEVPEEKYESGKFNDNKNLTFNLSSDNTNSIQELIRNPITSSNYYI